MASRRCLGALSLRRRSVLQPSAFELPRTLTLTLRNVCPPTIRYPHSHPFAPSAGFRHNFRNLSSRPPYSSGEEEEEEDDEGGEEDEYDGDEEEGEGDSGEEEEGAEVSTRVVQSGKSEAEKVKEAAEIGYKVIGPLDSSENPFKPWEPVFAVVQIGSHQFKVSNRDSIFTERLKFCEVNDKLILNKVLMLGSNNQTIIGRPVLPDAAVHAVVEEHALDAKVIIFKKKRRKNYRRTKGHRQELTKLRITDIQGIDKAENTPIAA